MTIEEKIKKYKENLDCFDETMDKYKFLLESTWVLLSLILK